MIAYAYLSALVLGAVLLGALLLLEPRGARRRGLRFAAFLVPTAGSVGLALHLLGWGEGFLTRLSVAGAVGATVAGVILLVTRSE